MSHIVLRHMTNQATKRNLVSLPAILASALTGNNLLGELTQDWDRLYGELGASEVLADG